MQNGIVFNIQRYSVDDGPGIRTTVFLKGCPLRCRWCSNPESQRIEPQILFDQSLCHGCGQCNKFCPREEKDLCTGCGKCVDACWYGAKKLCGVTMSVRDVMEMVCRDVAYYRESGGGVTLSGGEPLMQIDFATKILASCRLAGIHAAIESAGCVPWDSFARAMPDLDLAYVDIKHVDAQKHQVFTGVHNGTILENVKRLVKEFQNTIVRIPCIPGFNDSPEDIDQIFHYLARISARRIEVLPFHRFGSGKYRELGKVYAYETTPPMCASQIEYVLDLAKRHGLNVTVKGRMG